MWNKLITNGLDIKLFYVYSDDKYSDLEVDVVVVIFQWAVYMLFGTHKFLNQFIILNWKFFKMEKMLIRKKGSLISVLHAKESGKFIGPTQSHISCLPKLILTEIHVNLMDGPIYEPHLAWSFFTLITI